LRRPSKAARTLAKPELPREAGVGLSVDAISLCPSGAISALAPVKEP
jgi:ferredoxin